MDRTVKKIEHSIYRTYWYTLMVKQKRTTLTVLYIVYKTYLGSY